MSQPATKQDLEQATTQLRGEMNDMEGRLSLQIEQSASRVAKETADAMMEQLPRQIEQSTSQVAKETANLMMEQIQKLISAVDEKYEHLPGQHKELRARFEAHAGDDRLHVRLPPAPAKRVRRPRAR